MLQAAGCRFDADFYLHHYGPYSEHVARLTDEMVRKGLLRETAEPVGTAEKFSYQLSDRAARQLAELENTNDGRACAAQLAALEARAKAWLQADVKTLEYASTILFFRVQGDNWPQAVTKAITFKRTPAVRGALGLAQQAVA